MFAAIALAIVLSACAHRATPLELADQTTKAVYAVDLSATQANFDDQLKTQVTREELGALSDKMHALGAYHGLKPISSDPDKGRYDFEADFAGGMLAVELRVDPSGKIGAYRIAPASAN
jgi:hypothetical protein